MGATVLVAPIIYKRKSTCKTNLLCWEDRYLHTERAFVIEVLTCIHWAYEKARRSSRDDDLLRLTCAGQPITNEENLLQLRGE